jgi:hypothetical protein
MHGSSTDRGGLDDQENRDELGANWNMPLVGQASVPGLGCPVLLDVPFLFLVPALRATAVDIYEATQEAYLSGKYPA